MAGRQPPKRGIRQRCSRPCPQPCRPAVRRSVADPAARGARAAAATKTRPPPVPPELGSRPRWWRVPPPWRASASAAVGRDAQGRAARRARAVAAAQTGRCMDPLRWSCSLPAGPRLATRPATASSRRGPQAAGRRVRCWRRRWRALPQARRRDSETLTALSLRIRLDLSLESAGTAPGSETRRPVTASDSEALAALNRSKLGDSEALAAFNRLAAVWVSNSPARRRALYQYFLLIQTNCKHFYSFLGPYINSCGSEARPVTAMRWGAARARCLRL